MTTSEKIIEELKKKRPNINNSSLITYESIIRNLYKKMFDSDDYDLNKFSNESNKVIKFLKEIPANKRKTILSALVVITDKKDYRDLMLNDIKTYNKEEEKQEIDDKKWITKDEILKVFKSLLNNAKLLYKKDKPTMDDIQEIQNFIIVCLLGGVFIPPRRSKDYVNLKIKNFTEKDNYMKKDYFIFNDYKTAKTYGQQSLEIPKELKTILSKWLLINDTDYLLFDSSKNKLTNVKLNQRLNKIFDKGIGVNQMRKSYLSEKYSDLIETKKALSKDFKDMGSSPAQENIYIKK